MYYSATSILPHRPEKNNNARIKFSNALFKKLAKQRIENNTKKAAKYVKKSVAARFTTTPRRSQSRHNNQLNSNSRPRNNKTKPVFSTTNLYKMNKQTRLKFKSASKSSVSNKHKNKHTYGAKSSVSKTKRSNASSIVFPFLHSKFV
jgi:hypothetical protein